MPDDEAASARTRVLLVRHAATEALGRRLSGWTPAVHLDAEGRGQAEALAAALAGTRLAAVYSSPLERAVETAAAFAARHGLEPTTVPELGEFQLGEWTGRSFEELERDERWRRFNAFRGGSRAPGGEHMLEVQARLVLWLERARERHRAATFAAVSHADPIRAALFHYGGISLDLVQRWQIAPASVTTLEFDDWSVRVLSVGVELGRREAT
jgi:probable phosphoglycerate mutase